MQQGHHGDHGRRLGERRKGSRDKFNWNLKRIIFIPRQILAFILKSLHHPQILFIGLNFKFPTSNLPSYPQKQATILKFPIVFMSNYSEIGSLDAKTA